MIILSIRTDKPTAEVGLYDNNRQLSYLTWEAHRELGVTIHQTIKQLLGDQQRDWSDVAGVVAFAGPGSFTGLRIGLTVANTLAYANDLPVVASRGGSWQADGIERLIRGESDHPASPEYGAEANITKPRESAKPRK